MASDPGFKATVREVAGGPIVLSLAGELDLTCVDELRSRFDLLGVGEPSAIVVDLRRLTFIDSSGLHALVTSARTIEASGGSAVFAGANEHVAGLFEVVRFAEVVPVEPSFEAALERAEREASAPT